MPEAGRATVKFVGDYSALMAGLTSTLAPGKLSGIGKKAGLAIGGAFAAAGAFSMVKDAVNVTKAFDKEISSLGAVAGATEKQMDKLRKQAIRLGADTSFSATEAAQAQTELAKGGLSAAQILGGSLKSALNLAAAGEMGLAEAAETTVNAMQLFEMQGKQTGAIADMLATAANRTTADVQDFAMSLKMGGSVAKQAGYDLNDTVVILEALAEAGIKNSDAGTSMKASLIQLLNPTKKQADLAAQLGVSWLKQNGELKNGIQISKELSKATADMTKAERTKTFAVLAGTDGFRTLAALYDAGVGSLRNYNRANRESGTAAEVAAKKLDNLAGDTEELSGAWETFQITIGTMVTPALRNLTQVATGAVNAVTRIFNDKNLSGGEKFQKLIELAVKGVAKGFEELTKAAVKAAPEVASAFASGFASAPIWMQLAGAGLMLKMFGGPTAIVATGTKAGGMFMAAFASVTETYSLARSFGRGKGASAFAGMGSLALPMATTLFSTLKKAIPGVAAAFAIGSTLSSAIAGDMEAALTKAGGALVGGGIGFAIGGPVGAAVGAGIGTGLSEKIVGLFSGAESPVKTLQEQIVEGTRRVRKALQNEFSSVRGLARSSKQVERARERQAQATNDLKVAERQALSAKKRYGENSVQAARAEVNLAKAKERSFRATQRLKNAERLEGAQRRTAKQVLKSSAQVQKEVLTIKQQELRNARREFIATSKGNASLEEKIAAQKRYDRAATQVSKAQKDLNRTYERANNQIGPKFASMLQKLTTNQLQFGRKFINTKRTVNTGSTSMVQRFRDIGSIGPIQFGRAEKGVEGFANTVKAKRKVINSNMRSMPPVQVASTDLMVEDFTEKIDAIGNSGAPQSKRRGGLVEWVRQRFQNGGVPVALSSGEMFKTPNGKTGVVPGRPTAADNVLTSMPVGTKIFTYDGQRRLMEGASESQAIRDQLPHFASGGIVKPEIVGGSNSARELANTAISKVHAKATAKLKKKRQEAAAAAAGSVAGYTGPPADFRQLGDNAYVDSHTLAVGAYLANKFGLSISSTYRSPAHNAAVGGVPNSSHTRGSASNPGAIDFVPASGAALSWASTHIAGLTEAMNHDAGSGLHLHLAFFRKGGLIRLLQAMAGGGLVRHPYFNESTKKGNINGLWPSADLTKDPDGWHALPTLPPYVFGALAEAAGRHFNIDVPGKAMMQMVMHEGGTPEGGKPGSRGTDRGGTVGYGPWAITTTFNDALVRRFGGSYAAMNNPVLNAAAMAHVVRDRPDLSAWYGDQYVTDPTAHWKGSYQLKNALGGIGYSAALRSALRGDFEGDREDSGESRQEQRKRESAARRKKREKSIRDLVAKAQNASGRRKKSLLWQVLQNYAAWGVFDAPMSKIVQGMVGVPGEQDHFLQRAREIAGIANPQGGGGQLTQLVKWLGRNVEVGGFEKKNSGLVNQLERMRDKGGDAAKDRRKRVHKRLARFGESFWFSGRLRKKDDRIAWLAETIENAEAWGSVASGPGGSELTDGEIAEQIGLNRQLLGVQRGKKGVLDQAIPYATHLISMYQQSIATALKDPKQKWKVPGYRRGLNAARTVLGSGDGDGLLGNLRSLVGLTGEGGEILQTRLKLEELGATTSVEGAAVSERDSEIIALLREQLQLSQRENMVLDAQLPVFKQFMPKFHSGGDVPGHGDVMALLEGRETVYTADQNSRIHGALSAAPNVNVDVYVNGVKADDSQVEMVVRQELGSQIGRGRRAGSNRRMVLPR